MEIFPFNIELFSPFLNKSFALLNPPVEGMELTLIEVNSYQLSERDGRNFPTSSVRRNPFHLIFSSKHFMPQGTYVLQHPEVGELPLFIVPIHPIGSDYLYQVIVS